MAIKEARAVSLFVFQETKIPQSCKEELERHARALQRVLQNDGELHSTSLTWEQLYLCSITTETFPEHGVAGVLVGRL